MSKPDYARLVKSASLTAIIVAVILIAIKTVAWLMTGSASLLASLIDSFVDAAASAVNFFALRWATKPADDDHRFGHGKAEALAALLQGGFIAGSALLLAMHGIDRLLHPTIVQHLALGMGSMAIATLVTIGLVIYQSWVIKQTDSTAIRADRLHYQSDVMMNLAILCSLALTWYGWHAADGIFALAIAAYMMFSVVSIIRHALDNLMDKELSDDERQHVINIVNNHPQTFGLHQLRTRKSAGTRFIQLHLELDDDLTLAESHAISDDIEAQIQALFDTVDVIIHQDPRSVVARNANAQEIRR
ncbi:cation diffusion facilitator family transporter [Echinimonas agarilytica]|uniref:Cation-efflux pump FieF n=1 Tax=Echinimonas agarilytica TaxID=1215918 RepID=A0AA42B8Y5_9GAMM|nr:cation diffusion facilitator family transporter [Echinimonas agarilytica]MCM2681053.1 cation diffusion facilitator family transporter [Echinimonas agarilytica]